MANRKDFIKAVKGYYKKLKEEYKKEYGTNPEIPFSPKLNKALLVGTEDEEGYIGWKPIEQKEYVDWEKLSSEGIVISETLKEYYSAMCFAPIEGRYADANIRLDSVGLYESVEDTVRKHFTLGKDEEEDDIDENSAEGEGNRFATIGSVEIDGNDGWELCYDNSDDSLFYYNEQEDELEECNFDLLTLISGMEVVC